MERSIHSLEITRQPPAIFANQQLGKRHGFYVEVKMQGPRLSAPAILKVNLVYADDFEIVPYKRPKKLGLKSLKRRRPDEILHLFTTNNVFSPAGDAFVRVRINDVSRNHHGRQFRLMLSATTHDAQTGAIYTTPIKVISKHPKSQSLAPSQVGTFPLRTIYCVPQMFRSRTIICRTNPTPKVQVLTPQRRVLTGHQTLF